MNKQDNSARRKAPARKDNITFLRVLIALFSVMAIALTGYLAWSLATRSSSVDTPYVTPEITGAPKLKADREVIDLGDIKLGNTTQATFTLTNIGDQLLKITGAPYIEVLEGC
jgi:nitrate reductase NapE component